MRAVRLWIKKEGRAKYISHLDMNRCFTRAVRRAKLNLWYTEGFNPHPYLNFLTPLSLGQESDGEPLDVRMEDETSDDEILERLNAALPEGVSVARVHDAVRKSAEIAFASYSVCIVLDTPDDAESFCLQAKALLDSGELTAEKSGKQGRHKVMKQVRLCEKIRDWSLTADGANVLLETVLRAGNDMLNPALLVDALQKNLGTDGLVRIRRRKFFCEDMTAFQ